MSPLPSNRWNLLDRNSVLFAISYAMARASSEGVLVKSTDVASWADRIHMVLSMNPDWLEDNREMILKDLTFQTLG